MKLSDRSQVETLAKFRGRDDLVTSFYLDMDKGRLTRKEIQVSLKNMLNTAKTDVESLDAAKEKKDSLTADLDRIFEYGSQDIVNSNARGLAAFACNRQNFWMPLELPHGPRNRVVFDSTFYVRPLDAILARYARICVLLFGRREAKWYEVFMEEIRHLGDLHSDVPAKVREGGFEGNQAKNIERHIDAHVQDHFKKTAQATFDLFKKHNFDWLFLSCEENHHDIETYLHTYLKERVKAKVKARVTDTPAKILKEVMEIEAGLKKTEEEDVVQRLITELERGGRACSGLRDTLQHLNQFEVQSLVVTHNYARQGHICPTHKYLFMDEPVCPVCQKKTDVVVDVIDEAIETALKRSATVRQVTPPSKLDRYGQIGAFLKYKV